MRLYFFYVTKGLLVESHHMTWASLCWHVQGLLLLLLLLLLLSKCFPSCWVLRSLLTFNLVTPCGHDTCAGIQFNFLLMFFFFSSKQMFSYHEVSLYSL